MALPDEPNNGHVYDHPKRDERSPPPYNNNARSYTPRRPPHAPVAPSPSNVLGVFGLSIRTAERDLDEEFGRYGRVEKVTIVYDQRTDRSRGFGFIKMSAVEEASRCIKELNGVELNGRRIRVDYSITDRPHAPTPGEYMGHRRSSQNQGGYRDYRDQDLRGYGGRGRDRDHYSRDHDRDSRGRDRDRDRVQYSRRSRDYQYDSHGRDNCHRSGSHSPPRPNDGFHSPPESNNRHTYSGGSHPSRVPHDFRSGPRPDSQSPSRKAHPSNGGYSDGDFR